MRGGAGTTYEAEDIETGGRVALTLLDVRSLGEWKKLDLFEREARTLNENRNGQSYLFKAAEQGQAEVAKILVDKGLPINEGDRQRWTPLGIACQSGHARVVELLLAQPGIDLSLKIGQAGRTPLMLAAESGNEDIVRQLLRKGVDVNEKASDDETALTVAERHKQRKIAAVLRENGAK